MSYWRDDTGRVGTDKEGRVIIYRGPSMFDGAPIVAFATGLNVRSTNAKTGAMVQTYMLAEQHPLEALHSGEDQAVCGDCILRPANGGGCYVNVGFGPSAVWRAYQRGKYLEEFNPEEVAKAMRGQLIRLGSYGDPAALPVGFWPPRLKYASGWTGYTHAWKTRPDLQGYTMGSVDNDEEMVEAQAAGWRTFRVRLATDPLVGREVICPASSEGGHRVQCARCLACDGNRKVDGVPKPNIAIVAHGRDAPKYTKWRRST
jgi:hypothetical protein